MRKTLLLILLGAAALGGCVVTPAGPYYGYYGYGDDYGYRYPYGHYPYRHRFYRHGYWYQAP